MDLDEYADENVPLFVPEHNEKKEKFLEKKREWEH